MSARRSESFSHNQQASQLRDQLQGLLPESLKPAAASVANEAGDGMQKLLSYAQLAAEYQEPIVALLQRLFRRAPAAAAAIPAARAALAPKRRFGVHPLTAIGIAVGLGLAGYGVMRVVQDLNRNA
jgi:hypothetical protein